jgi:hypothetical protein
MGEVYRARDGGTDARYVPTGHLVYALGGYVLAAAFDMARLEVVGAFPRGDISSRKPMNDPGRVAVVRP